MLIKTVDIDNLIGKLSCLNSLNITSAKPEVGKWINQFNDLSISNKKSFIYTILNNYGEFIGKCMNNKEDVHLYKFGTMKIKPNRAFVIEARNKLAVDMGYDDYAHMDIDDKRKIVPIITEMLINKDMSVRLNKVQFKTYNSTRPINGTDFPELTAKLFKGVVKK